MPGAIQRTLPSFACVFNISVMQSSRADAVSPRLNSEQSEVQIFRVRFVENKNERGAGEEKESTQEHEMDLVPQNVVAVCIS